MLHTKFQASKPSGSEEEDFLILFYVFLCFEPRTGRLVGCFRHNGPLRQYFSLYRTDSQREGETKDNDRREKKCLNNPHPHPLQAQ